MVSSAIWIKHARVSFSKSIKIAQTRVLVLSKFHEKPSYYVLIIYIKMFETLVVLAYVDTANRPLTKFSWLCYVTLYNANSFKISLNYNEVLLVLFKVKSFPFKKKDKSHIFHPTPPQLLLSIARPPCLLCLKQSVIVT
jgi:hypothetical protein